LLVGVPHQRVYFWLTHVRPKVRSELRQRIRALTEQVSSFGHRIPAGLFCINRGAEKRIYQISDWGLGERAIGNQPRLGAVPAATMGAGPEQALISRYES
jgi:hypothetical protein